MNQDETVQRRRRQIETAQRNRRKKIYEAIRRENQDASGMQGELPGFNLPAQGSDAVEAQVVRLGHRLESLESDISALSRRVDRLLSGMRIVLGVKDEMLYEPLTEDHQKEL